MNRRSFEMFLQLMSLGCANGVMVSLKLVRAAYSSSLPMMYDSSICDSLKV